MIKSKGSIIHGCKNKYLKGTMTISLNNNTQPKAQDLFTHTFFDQVSRTSHDFLSKVSLKSNQNVDDYSHISCATVASATTLSGCYLSS